MVNIRRNTFPGSEQPIRLSDEVCVILFVGAVQNTMGDVANCRSLDTEQLPTSFDSEVKHDERRLWDWKRVNIVGVKQIICIVKAFSTSMRKTWICWWVFVFLVCSCLWRRVLQTSV